MTEDGAKTMELQGKRIIITGAARGMGAATVRAYVRAGATVTAMDLDDDLGEEVAAAANREGPGRATYRHVDVSDSSSVESTFGAAIEDMGGLDVLAHPAAIQRSDLAEEVTDEDWDRMFAVNVRGTMLTNQAAFKAMESGGNGGSIINFGSISGLRPEPSASAYSASKGAVHSWTRTAAASWGDAGVRVNAILPAIATPMYDEAMSRLTPEQADAHRWQNEESIALGKKYGDPDRDLGPVMVFFASDASRFITGQLIPVDGGQTSVR
jgi:NAD(P)-dependent dehydrogenase (short-subunit alcohol dehydrogenase family)